MATKPQVVILPVIINTADRLPAEPDKERYWSADALYNSTSFGHVDL
jgi:hypothetical protein